MPNTEITKSIEILNRKINNLCCLIRKCLGIKSTGDENKFLNQKGQWVGGLDENIYNTDGILTDNRTLTIGDKYLALGNPSTEDTYFAIGDLTPFGLTNSFISAQAENIELYCPIVQDQGFFFGIKNDDGNLEGVIVLQQRATNENIGAISVYDEDGIEQKGRVAANYNKTTGNGYGMICMASDYNGSNRNYFAAFNDQIKGRYYHSSTGDLMAMTIDDSGYIIDVDGDAYFNVDYDGQMGSESLAPLNFADDTAAAAGGIRLNNFYHNNGALRIRLT